jgi:hypothetical protein
LVDDNRPVNSILYKEIDELPKEFNSEESIFVSNFDLEDIHTNNFYQNENFIILNQQIYEKDTIKELKDFDEV